MENYIQQLVFVLRGFAYVSMVLALLHAVHDFRSGQNVTKYIVYLLCLTAFIAFYDTILDYGCQMFDQGVNDAREQTYLVWDEIDAGISGNSNVGGILDRYILIPLTKGLLTCCRLFHFISGFVQTAFKVIYRVSAPLALGLAAWRVFISTGVRFAAGTLWLCCWKVGCAIADIILLKILLAVLSKSILSGASGVAGAVAAKMVVTGTAKIAVSPAVLWALLFGLIIFLITAITLYFLIPIALYHIICAGDVVQGATHAMTGAIGAGTAVNNSIGKTFGAARGGNGGGSGGGGENSPALASDSSNAGNTASSGSTGSANTSANRSHAALAEAAERQLEKRNV